VSERYREPLPVHVNGQNAVRQLPGFGDRLLNGTTDQFRVRRRRIDPAPQILRQETSRTSNGRQLLAQAVVYLPNPLILMLAYGNDIRSSWRRSQHADPGHVGGPSFVNRHGGERDDTEIKHPVHEGQAHTVIGLVGMSARLRDPPSHGTT